MGKTTKTISLIKDAPLPDITGVRTDLPKDVDVFVHGLLAKNSDWRFEDTKDVVQHIEKLRSALSAPLRATQGAGNEDRKTNPLRQRTPAPAQAGPHAQRTNPKRQQDTPDNRNSERLSIGAKRAEDRKQFWQAMNALGFAASVAIAGFIAFDLYTHKQKMGKTLPAPTATEATPLLSQPAPRPNSTIEQATPPTAPVQKSQVPPENNPSTEVLANNHNSIRNQATQLAEQHRFAEAELLIRNSNMPNKEAVLSNLRQQARRWYRDQVKPLTYTRDRIELRSHFDILTGLRERVASPDRADCEARWYSALDSLRLDLLVDAKLLNTWKVVN